MNTEFVVTPLIENIGNHIKDNTEQKESFKFKVNNNDAISYLRKFKHNIIDYFKHTINEDVKITVRRDSVYVKIIKNCSLCDGRFDFRNVLISEYSGVQMSNCLEQVKYYNKFNYCPNCGKKLTSKNFGFHDI